MGKKPKLGKTITSTLKDLEDFKKGFDYFKKGFVNDAFKEQKMSIQELEDIFPEFINSKEPAYLNLTRKI